MNQEENSIKNIFLEISHTFIYLKKNGIKIISLPFIGGLIGLLSVFFIETKYKSTMLFVLEEEKQSGISGVGGIASQLGLDINSSSNSIFAGNNLMELMRTKLLVQKALLMPITFNKQKITLIDYYNLKINKKPQIKYSINQRLETLNSANFDEIKNLSSYLISKSILVKPKDKKSIFINLEITSKDEYFSKTFCTQLAQVTTDYYIETKSKRARINFEILQKQYDSVRNILNNNINNAASSVDKVFNINPSKLINKTPYTKNQLGVTLNTAIITQLVSSLEMAKLNLRKETPLIQIIEGPEYSTEKIEADKLTSFVTWYFIIFFFTIIYYLLKKFIETNIN